MTTADESGGHEPKSTYRSRWGRFSPSMGWKAFWSEIIIVVLGVMIALAANEVVENWNWQKKVAAGEVKLQREAATNFNFAAEQVSVAPCIEAQLEALKGRLLASDGVLNPAPLFNDLNDSFDTYVYRLPNRPYVISVWQALNDDGTASHMDNWRQQMYSQMNTQILNMTERNSQSNSLVSRSAMFSNAIPLDPSTRAMLLAELMEQKGNARLKLVDAIDIMSYVRDLGQAPPSKFVQENIQNQSGTVAFCKAQGFPVADWQQVLDKEPVEAPY